MRFAEASEGPWQIYAGALESPRGDGFTAAVAVQQRGDHRAAWREERLAGGHRWPDADEALRYALARGRQLVQGGVVAAAVSVPAGGAQSAQP